MLTSSGSGGITSIGRTKTYYTNVKRSAAAPASAGHKYDSASFSAVPAERSTFMDMVGRLSQEVRTTNTTGDIQALRQQVSSGAYTPDPMAIAGRILFMVEE